MLEIFQRSIRHYFHFRRFTSIKPIVLIIIPLLILLLFMELNRYKRLKASYINGSVEVYASEAKRRLPKHINLEKRAKALLSPMIKQEIITNLIRKPLLCSTFVKWEGNTVDLLVRNINHTRHHCDWLVIAYDANGFSVPYLERSLYDNLKMLDPHSAQSVDSVKVVVAPPKQQSLEFFKDLCESFVTKFLNFDTQHSPLSACHVLNDTSVSTYNPSLYAKGSLFTLLLEHLPRYHYIWTLDSDIDLQALDLDRFFHIFTCSFKNPPIMGQPLIYETTQGYRYLLRDYWKNTKALASAVGFIEIQAPIFEETFLEYFIIAFILPFLPAMVVLGGDWGIDEMFCSAAKEFARYRNKGLHDHPICAVVLNNMAVHHKNRKEIIQTVGKQMRNQVNGVLMKLIRKQFPHYARHGKQYFVNPFNIGTSFPRIYELNSSCNCFLCREDMSF